MKTLHLNLKKKWFDMILSGKKKEEYREISNYWRKRFCNRYMILSKEMFLDLPLKNMNGAFEKLRDIKTITFSNGYAKDRPQFEIEFKGIELKEGNPNWGAEKGVKYFALKLGELIQRTDQPRE